MTSEREDRPSNETRAAARRAAELAMRTLPRSMGILRARSRETGWGSPQRAWILRTLRGGPRGLGDLATKLSVSAPTMSGLVTALVREGLVTRETDPSDRRRVTVRITPEGADQLARADADALDVLAARFAGLSGGEILTLEKGLALLRRALEMDGVDCGPSAADKEA